MDKSLHARLLEELKHSDRAIRQRATAQMWQIWFYQKGELGLEILRRSQFFLDAGDFNRAEILLTEAINSYPDFIEAWNRRAILYYTEKKYEQSRDDCEQVVMLNPFHFGAWHGLGLCHTVLKDYPAAIQSFKKALEIQPYATINQKLILECTMHF